MNLHDLLGVALLLGQLTSWLSLRDRLAAIRAAFGEFKGATIRQADGLERRIAALERGTPAPARE